MGTGDDVLFQNTGTNVYTCLSFDAHEETQRACTVSIPESSIQFLIILL